MNKFTDLSKPLPVTDPERLRAACQKIIMILFELPLVDPVSVSCFQNTTEARSVNKLEAPK